VNRFFIDFFGRHGVWRGGFSRAAVRAALLIGMAMPATFSSEVNWKKDAPLAEVRENVLSQRVGEATVRELALPDAFVRRVSDHVCRESFQAYFRQVGGGPGVPAPASDTSVGPPGGTEAAAASAATALAARFTGLSERPPALRGFRINTIEDEGWLPELPADASAEERAAATLIAKRLATDGLLSTTLQAIAALKHEPGAPIAPLIERLQRAGLPVDLLAHFDDAPADRRQPGDWRNAAARTLETLASLAHSGMPGPQLAEKLATWPFRPVGSGFRAAAENGVRPWAGIRINLTRGDNWPGPGGGYALDALRNLLTNTDTVPAWVGVETRFQRILKENLAEWPELLRKRVTLAPSPMVLSAWAQDNGEPGTLNGAPATLIPRYASRAEELSVFVPGDSFAAASPIEGGPARVASSLLFQGGNLLVVETPAGGERVLLLGEAEVCRNVALGLRPAQVEAHFAAEFGVDRVVVLPAVSFHLDLEVTCRGGPAGMTAFVVDTVAGAKLVATAGLPACVAAGLLQEADAQAARFALDASDWNGFFGRVLPAVQAAQVRPGVWPYSLAAHFAKRTHEHAAANFRRFLAALDYLMAEAIDPDATAMDDYTRSYLRSIRRLAADRAALRRQIESLGWRVVPTPAFEEPGLSVNPLNALHAPGAMYYSAYGDIFEPLDEAARAVFARELGESVKVIAIPTAALQIRVGGLHCATMVYVK
jgi:hypothetical protein